jgi:hypothetical protein
MTKRTLTLSGGPAAYTLAIDGQDVSRGIRRLTIEADPRNRGPRVEAELAIDAIEVTALAVEEPEFLVSMPNEARIALIAAGWTPPAGDR